MKLGSTEQEGSLHCVGRGSFQRRRGASGLMMVLPPPESLQKRPLSLLSKVSLKEFALFTLELAL